MSNNPFQDLLDAQLNAKFDEHQREALRLIGQETNPLQLVKMGMTFSELIAGGKTAHIRNGFRNLTLAALRRMHRDFGFGDMEGVSYEEAEFDLTDGFENEAEVA